MYAQVTKIHVGLDTMPTFRAFINQTYLPQLQNREGFLGMMLLEQIDDRDSAELVVLWENQQAVEAFSKTGSLASSVQALEQSMAGVHARRESFIVTEQHGVTAQSTAPIAEV